MTDPPPSEVLIMSINVFSEAGAIAWWVLT